MTYRRFGCPRESRVDTTDVTGFRGSSVSSTVSTFEKYGNIRLFPSTKKNQSDIHKVTMTYFNIPFTKDLIRDLLIETSDLDQLYQVLPQQLWNLSGPHGRLLQDGEFYGQKIKDRYGVDKLPKIPGEFWVEDTVHKFKDDLGECQRVDGLVEEDFDS